MTQMKHKLIATLVALFTIASSAQAQFSSMTGGFMLGGGYLEDPEKVYGFGQLRGTFYEDDAFSHTVFLEILGHVDDAVLDFGGFTEDGDITFINLSLNYELEAKLFGPVSAYAGAGIGVELISLDDRFDLEIDSDANFMSQVFLGLRADFGNGFQLQAGARYLMREDFELLNGQFITEDSWAYEIGAGFQF